MAKSKAEIERHFIAASGRLALLVVVLLVALLGVFSWAVLQFGRGLTPQQFFGFVALLSFIATIPLFFIFKTSTAEVWGEKSGVSFKLGGPVAGFVIVFAALWSMRPGPESRTVKVILVHNGQQLGGAFSIIPTIPGVDVGRRRAQNSQVSMQIPAHITQIDSILFDMPGYRVKDPAPFKIGDNGVVMLELVETEPGPPAKPSERHSSAMFRDLPTREAVEKPGKHPAKECGLFYRNMTDQKLTLLILDCSRHYRILDAKESGEQAWLYFPFDPSENFEYYQRLDNSTGWYCFAVIDEDGKAHPLSPLSAKNLCEKKITKMTVTSPREEVYEVRWQ